MFTKLFVSQGKKDEAFFLFLHSVCYCILFGLKMGKNPSSQISGWKAEVHASNFKYSYRYYSL